MHARVEFDRGALVGLDDHGLVLLLEQAFDDAAHTAHADIGAAVQEVSSAGKVSVIGFCFGGYATYVAACTVDGVSAAMPFYGGGIAAKVSDMQPKCPTQFHFGDKDAAIPLDDLQKIKDALQDSPLYVYDDSGHGFTCDDRDSFNPGATERAFARAVAWMDEHAA